MIEIDITVNKRSANHPALRRKIFLTNWNEALLIFAAILHINIRLGFYNYPFIKKKIVQD